MAHTRRGPGDAHIAEPSQEISAVAGSDSTTPSTDNRPSPPAPDFAEAERFLKALDPTATRFTFQTFDDDRDRKDDALAKISHGTLVECWDDLKRYNAFRAGIFVTVNETDFRGRKATNIKRVRAVFIDGDGAPLEPILAYSKQPHIIVDSSPGRFHSYWLVSDVDRSKFSDIQKALIRRFDSDPEVNDLPRVMRLPGFIHWKDKSAPHFTKILQVTDRAPYAASDFVDVPVDLGRVNAAAMRDLDAWVPKVFGDDAEKQSHGGYRVSSEALSRDLEEDLSIHPSGIKDFGVHDMGDAREGRRTPVDVVMEFTDKRGEASAAAWLSQVLGLKDLPVIKVVGGRIANMIDAAEDALVKANVSMFVRAGSLVFPTITEYPAADDTKTIAVVLKAAHTENVVYELNRCATFTKYDARSRSWVTVDPPDKVAGGLLHKGQWKLPKVVGVTTVPTMRPDGTILDTPGYDEATQLWYEPDPYLHVPRIGETKEEAQAALEKLDALLDGYPFVTQLDRSVVLAMLIAPVVRGAFDVGPGCHTRAHEVAQGKSHLANLIAAILTGKPCPVAPYVEEEREVEKTLDALILAGVPIVSIDNCTHDVGGARLCQMVEQQVVFVRILGKSEVPPCEWRGTLLTNGNNVDVVGDYTRRSLQTNLDAGVESDQVHLRKFKFDPIRVVLKDRGTYVAAALTVARAFRATGARVECDPVASYGRWSRIVREPLIWLGREDVVKSINLTRQEDPARAETRSLYDQWQKCFGFKTPHTAAELVEKVTEFVEGRDGEGRYFRNPAYPELLELLSTKVDKRGNVSALVVGHWLRAVEGQVHRGRKLTRAATRATGGGVQYILTEVGSPGGVGGIGGICMGDA